MKDKYSELKYGLRDTQNAFRFWFDKVKECGIRVPKTVVFDVPVEIVRSFYMENQDKDYETVNKWVKEVVRPKLADEKLHGLLFIKNGVFSNKFDAGRSCMSIESNAMTDNIININYTALSMIMGYDGTNQLVVRERIPHDMQKTPCFYNGLPLRSEFRVFYDFDSHEIIFTANYWEYDYVAPHLYDVTDKIIFESQKETLEKEFEARKSEVEKLVAEKMANINSLSGPWSIDLLWEGEQYWLIDMAVAEQSAFWEKRHGKIIEGK